MMNQSKFIRFSFFKEFQGNLEIVGTYLKRDGKSLIKFSRVVLNSFGQSSRGDLAVASTLWGAQARLGLHVSYYAIITRFPVSSRIPETAIKFHVYL